MHLRFLKLPVSLLVLIILVSGCFESEYTRLVKAEMKKGVRYDSLLMGLKFGDTRNHFQGICFDLNKARKISAGVSGTIQYMIKDSTTHLGHPDIRLLFVPGFDKQDKIVNMDLKFTYIGWAPWNKSLQADSLAEVVQKIIMKWYGGNEFITAKLNGEKIPVKIDGNRRMSLFIQEPSDVIVKQHDIFHSRYKHSIFRDENEKQKD